MKKCSHPRLRSFTFKSGEVMSMCPDCSFGEGHTDSRYTKRRGPKEPEPEPEQDEIETSETESPEPELAELQVGQSFASVDDEDDTPVLSDIETDEDAEEVEEEIEEEEVA